MILNPAYRIVAGPSVWDSLPDTTLWWPPRRALRRRRATPEELAGLGNFLKKVVSTVTKIARAPIKLISPKLASNLEKIDNKILNTADKIHTQVNKAAQSVGKFVQKNIGWIAVVAAIAITIYSMGSGATIAAKMLSGMKAIGAKVGIGTAASSAATATATTATAATATASAATAGSAGWLATTGKLAMSAASALVGGAKVSALSQQQAQAVMEAQAAGYDLGASDAQLMAALQQRAAIAGAGIPTDANGNPLVDGPVVGATPAVASPAKAPANAPAAPAGAVALPVAKAPAGNIQAQPMPPAQSRPKTTFEEITSSPYFVPTAIGAGALLLVLLLRR